MAVNIREYEVKKYELWLAETECNLPLLLKKTLLLNINCENQVHAELVSIFSLIILLYYLILSLSIVKNKHTYSYSPKFL